jgi:hypothetical protein
VQHCIWRGVNPIEIGVVKGELHSDELYAQCAAGIDCPVLRREEDGSISGCGGIVDDVAIRTVT